MDKKFLIAIGTGEYDHLPEDWQRPQLKDVVDSIAQLFTVSLGYDRVLEEIGTDPTSQELSQTLDRWFASNERDCSDWVVFYYTGHGELVGSDRLYLLTKNYESGMPSTAFSLSQLGDMLIGRTPFGENRKVRHFLLILDTCHSGAGVLALSREISNLFYQGINGSMFYGLAAAFPNAEAMAGGLAKALISSLEDEALGGAQQEFIYFDQLIPAINRKLRCHKVVYCPVLSPEEEPKFFPNPRFIKGLPLSATVEEIRQITNTRELQTFWDPISRGVEFGQQLGWYFTGRDRVLRELSEWLNNSGDSTTRVITGGAGSGKSAILSKIVTLSDPQYRQKIPRRNQGWNKAFPLRIINLAIHAKGKTLDEIMGRFATQLGVEPNRVQVLDAFRKLQDPFHIVLDALDEAREPTRIAQELLEPLNSISNVKLLVGTRPEYAGKLGATAIQLHIDQPQYLEKSDLTNYVEARLLGRGEKATKTLYKRKSTLARKVAEAVADKAYPNFLIARLVSENLLASSKVVDPQLIESRAFPDTVGKAFEQYLSRYGSKEREVRDLLTPLAWAEGLGLPWSNIWPSLASTLSRCSYQDDDIRWLLQHAGSFVVETVEKNRSVYRLYHQALADYLRKGYDREQVQRLFVEVLLNTVPLLTDDRSKNWLLAHPYVLTHLVEHAAYCNMLTELVNDPFYLLAADPNRLVPVLAKFGDTIPRDIFNIYAGTVHHIREKPIGEAASYFELNARQNGLTEFADRIAQLPLNCYWRALWARWNPRTPSQAFGKGNSEISALKVASWVSSEPVALVGRRDGSAEVWRIADGALLTRWKPDGVEFVWDLALAETQDGWLLVAAWYSGYLGVFNLTTNATIAMRDLEGIDDAKVTALCVTERDGQPICVTAQRNFRLAIWELPSLNLIEERPNATESTIYCFHIVQHGSESSLLSGNFDSKRLSGERDDSKLRLWSLQDLSLLWEDRRGEGVLVNQIESGVYLGKSLLIASQDSWGPPEVWDWNSRQNIFRGDSPTARTWLYEFREEIFLISVSRDRRLNIYRVIPSIQEEELSLTCTPIGASIPVEGEKFTGIIELSGHAVVLSSCLDHVRIWDLNGLIAMVSSRGEDSEPNLKTAKYFAAVKSLATISTPSPLHPFAPLRELYLGTEGKIVTVDAATGDFQWEKIVSNNGQIQALAVSPKQDYLVAGTYDGFIHILEIANNGSSLRSISVGEHLERLRVVDWQGRTLAFATVATGKAWDTWQVRIWDIQTGEEVTSDCEYRLYYGEEDKPMYGLSVTKVNQSVRMAFASKYGRVIVANFVDIAKVNRFKHPLNCYESWPVPYTQEEYIHSLASGWVSDELLLAAGTEYGHLTIWNFLSGEVKSSRADAHIDKISVLCFHTLAEREVLISGGDDGILRFWTLELSELFAIEIDESINDITWVGKELLAVGTKRGVLTLQFNFI